MLGVAGTRTKITPEVIAINIDDALAAEFGENRNQQEKVE